MRDTGEQCDLGDRNDDSEIDGCRTNMGGDSIGSTGSGSPISIVQPYSVLRFIMAIAGRMPRDEVRVLRGVSDRFQS